MIDGYQVVAREVLREIHAVLEGDSVKRVALVDSENATALKSKQFRFYDLVVLIGSNANTIYRDLNAIRLVPISSGRPNNADFHIAFVVGQISIYCGGKGLLLHIISADKGFDGFLRLTPKRYKRIDPSATQSIPAKRKMVNPSASS